LIQKKTFFWGGGEVRGQRVSIML